VTTWASVSHTTSWPGSASSRRQIWLPIVPLGTNSAASWPEPMAVLLTIVLTFFGAAACYRIGVHVSVLVARNALPAPLRRATELLSEGLMALISLFMAIRGLTLVETTWYQTIADFPALSVGVTYLPIPIGGLITMLFAIERVTIGPPQQIAESPAPAHPID